ncbi:zinc ribbon domain-containing protein, partial [Campylobacter coli]
AKEEQNLDEIRVSISSQMDGLEKERMNVYTKKTKLVAEMNQKVLSFYEKIRKWAKNTAVVPVKKQACYGCFMKIYDKTYLSVIKGEEIITCPHCGRILYKEQEDQN